MTTAIHSSLVPNGTMATLRDQQEAYVPKYPGLVSFSKSYVEIHGYIAAVVCIWGIGANLANVVVLTRKNMQSSTNMILLWLAVSNLLTMISYFPVSIHFYIMQDPALTFPQTRSHSWITFLLFHVSFTVVCHTISIWVTIVLAIFRYLYICYPASGAILCDMVRAKKSILAIYISTVILCIPNYLVTAIKEDTCSVSRRTCKDTRQNWMDLPPENFTYYELGDSAISEPFLMKFNYWIQAIFIKLVPCALLTVLTILLIVLMHHANRRRMKLKSQGKKAESDRAQEHNRTTAMLLAVVGLFLITELPQGILTLCSIFVPNFFWDVYWPLGDLLDISALLNNSINFVLYCSMSRQFRNTFVSTFCGCCPKSKPGWMKLSTFSSASNGTTATKV